MACQAIRSWTLSRLIGAFLDLAIAYFLLCCSTVAFFIFKVLGFFGFSLPCPCNGFLSKPDPDHCLQRLLVDSPTNIISAVQFSIRSKFPFNSVWDRNEDCELSFKVVREKNLDRGVIELEGEASCSSVSVARRSPSVNAIDLHWKSEGLAATKEGSFDVKGKGVAHRQRGNLRRRRRSNTDHIRLTPNSLYDNVRSGAPVVPLSKYGDGNTGNDITSENSTSADSHDAMKSSNMMELGHKSWRSSQSNDVIDANKFMDKDMVPLRNQKSDAGQHLQHDDHLENQFRILEQALEEERAARAALFFDLEKERSAAATAADEAMAMISRLQEEKAAIELEARQYERILEISLHMMQRNHCQEREGETLFEDVPDLQEEENNSLLVPGEDERLVVQQPSESMGSTGIMQSSDNFSNSASVSVHDAFPLTQHYEVPETVVRDDNHCCSVRQVNLHSTVDFSEEFQAKGVLSVARPKENRSSESHDIRYYEKSMPLIGEVKNDRASELNEQEDGRDLGLQGGTLNVKEKNLHDIHIIDDKCIIRENDKNELLMIHEDTSNALPKNELPSEAHEVQEVDESSCCATAGYSCMHSISTVKASNLNRPNNEVKASNFSTLPPLNRPNNKVKASNLRRHSISTVADERQKINNEVGWLRKRLKSIQASREKLNFSLEHRDKGDTQLIFSEDIANLFQEIQQFTEAQ